MNKENCALKLVDEIILYYCLLILSFADRHQVNEKKLINWPIWR